MFALYIRKPPMFKDLVLEKLFVTEQQLFKHLAKLCENGDTLCDMEIRNCGNAFPAKRWFQQMSRSLLASV